MNKSNVITNVIINSNIGFYNYNNKNWSIGYNSFRLYQYHERGSGNQLSNFIAEAQKRFFEFVIKASKIYGFNFRLIPMQIEWINICNRFNSEFQKMRDSVDNDVDEEGDPLYYSGDTTCTFNLNTSILKYNTIIINSKNNKKQSITGINTTSQPILNFKFSNVNIRSSKN